MENPEIDPSTWRNVLYDKGNIFGATMTQINDCWPTGRLSGKNNVW